MSAKGKVVAVIGGGLTGEDCVETALLQGATQVHQFEILDKPPANACGHLAEDNEKITRRFCVATEQFIGTGGKVSELRANHVRWENVAGKKVMQDIPAGGFSRKIDMVLLAMGFEHRLDGELARQLGIGLDSAGKPIINCSATTANGVFIAGDAASGATYVATAIDSGRKAAERIEQYLGHEMLVKNTDPD